MIKKFDQFINEGFASDLWGAIEAGINTFKANRKAQRMADTEMDEILDGKTEVSNGTVTAVLLKQLMERSSWLAELMTDKSVVYSSSVYTGQLERIEKIIEKLKESIIDRPVDGNDSNDYEE